MLYRRRRCCFGYSFLRLCVCQLSFSLLIDYWLPLEFLHELEVQVLTSTKDKGDILSICFCLSDDHDEDR